MANVRIAGVVLPQQKRIEAALSYIYGVGFPRSRQILQAVKVDPSKRTKDLSEAEVSRLKEFIEGNYKVEGALRQEIQLNVKRLKEIGSYTKTNSRTVRGNVRRTAGSGRKSAAEKT